MRLHTNLFGPENPGTPTILALHGLTGHGRRWESLAGDQLPGVRIVAPDLIGHGQSPWTPPWGFDATLTALAEVVDEHIPAAGRPFVVVGHSFGGALAVRLAHRLGSATVRGLLLLDPAQGLDPQRALEMATDSLAHWTYPDAAAARVAKRAEGWADIPDSVLDKEIREHLVTVDGGRVGWRVCAPAAATAWSEMAADAVLPPAGMPTTIVVADRVQPSLVGTDFLRACVAQQPDDVTVVHADCAHMVPFLAPELTAGCLRDLLDRR